VHVFVYSLTALSLFASRFTLFYNLIYFRFSLIIVLFKSSVSAGMQLCDLSPP